MKPACCHRSTEQATAEHKLPLGRVTGLLQVLDVQCALGHSSAGCWTAVGGPSEERREKREEKSRLEVARLAKQVPKYLHTVLT